MKKLSRAVTLRSANAAALALASRRRATAAQAGPISAIFLTRSRMPAKSALASAEPGVLGFGRGPPRHGGETRADIGHLLDPLANAGEIGIGLDAAPRMDVERA